MTSQSRDNRFICHSDSLGELPGAPALTRRCRGRPLFCQGETMPVTRYSAGIFLATLMIACIGTVCGQNYPTKPIRIVTGGIGGGTDLSSRLLGQGFSAAWGQPVVVENRAGANGVIAAEIVAKSPADGYTLLLYSGTFWILPLLQNTPYNPVRDFSPIAMVTVSPNVLVVHPSLAVKSVNELLDLAKARPGALNYASIGSGSASHLAGELFKAMAGVSIVWVPFKSSAQAFTDLLGGQVQLMFATAGTVASHLKSGKLRALAVTSAEPSVLAPGLPTVTTSGLPGFEAVTVYGSFAPAKTPLTIVKRLNQEIVRVLNGVEVKERLLNLGFDVGNGPPEHLATAMKSEIARLGKVIKDAGIKAD